MEEDLSKTIEKAHAEFKKQNFQPAEELYTTFISSCLHMGKCQASKLAHAFNNRGQIKYFRVDFYEAMEDYTKAMQADGQFDVPYYNRGLIRYRLGFFEDAKSDFQQALYSLIQISKMPKLAYNKHCWTSSTTSIEDTECNRNRPKT